MATLTIELEPHVKAAVDEMAARTKVSPGTLVALLMQAFVENDGKIYTGAWPEGPGVRMLPDWPRFSSGVVKVKADA